MFSWNPILCSLISEALPFQVLIKNFKFVKFVVSIFFLTDGFFNFQFCNDHILDFMESEHIVMKQSLPIYIIFYVKYTEI